MNILIGRICFCNPGMILDHLKEMKIQTVIGFLFILGLMFMSAVRLMYTQHKLYKYLRENHTEKWKYLTTFLGLGPGGANSWKGIKFLLSQDYLGDPELLRLKVVCKNSLIYVIIGIGCVIIMFCLMSYAYIK